MKRADGTHWELPDIDTLTPDERVSILSQLKPGAVITYPDGTQYKASWKPARYYTCQDSGMLWRVMTARKL